MDTDDVDHELEQLESDLVEDDPTFARCVRKLEHRLRRRARRASAGGSTEFRTPGAGETMLWSLALMSGSGVAISAWYEAFRRF